MVNAGSTGYFDQSLEAQFPLRLISLLLFDDSPKALLKSNTNPSLWNSPKSLRVSKPTISTRPTSKP